MQVSCDAHMGYHPTRILARTNSDEYVTGHAFHVKFMFISSGRLCIVQHVLVDH
jgi:hypothetical protein